MLRHRLISGLANVVIIDVRGLLSPSLRSPPDLGLLSSHNGPQDINTSPKIIWIFSEAFGIVSTGRIFPKQGRSLYFGESMFFFLSPAVFFSFIQRSYSAGSCASPSGNLVDRQVDPKPDAEKTGESSSEVEGRALRPSAHVPPARRKVPPETALARLTPDRLLPLPLATCLSQSPHLVSLFSSLAVVPISFLRHPYCRGRCKRVPGHAQNQAESSSDECLLEALMNILKPCGLCSKCL